MSSLQHPLSWWLANDIVLSLGQIGQIIDLGYYKVGDGNNPFSGLLLQGLDPESIWFSTWGAIPNNGSGAFNVSTETLIGGTLVQQGGFLEVKYSLIPANNSNTKTAKLIVNNTVIATVTLPTSSANPVVIEGYIKCLDYSANTAYYSIEAKSAAGIIILKEGIVTIEWNANNSLILQLQGTASADIVYQGGHGKINIVSRLIPN